MNENKNKNLPAERQSGQPERKTEMTRDLPVFTPEADIFEKDDALLVICDMPGVAESAVDIDLKDDVLTITGQQSDQSPEKGQLVYRGYATGIYRRAFTLATDIDREKIKARLVNGVLSITLPKAESVRPRKIAVETA